MRRLTLAVAAVIGLGAFGQARAELTFTLSDLLTGGSQSSVTIGDKIFDMFQFSSVGFLGAEGADADLIAVTFLDPTDDGTYNVVFQSASQFQAGAGQEQDTSLSFRVRTTSGDPLIDGVDLQLGGIAGDGTVDLIEGVDFGSGFTTLVVGTIADTLTDFESIPNSSEIFVTKDLAIIGGETGTTRITDFTQSFHQTGVIVPEPSSVILMGMGGMLLVGYGWRRRKSS